MATKITDENYYAKRCSPSPPQPDKHFVNANPVQPPSKDASHHNCSLHTTRGPHMALDQVYRTRRSTCCSGVATPTPLPRHAREEFSATSRLSPPLAVIHTIALNDNTVLCGRGSTINAHQGSPCVPQGVRPMRVTVTPPAPSAPLPRCASAPHWSAFMASSPPLGSR